MTTTYHDWKIRGGRLVSFPPVLVAGIINLTPDSFSDGGEFFDPVKALKHALKLEEDGAGILDIGGESTRPGAAPVDSWEESRRVVPLVEVLVEMRVNGDNAGKTHGAMISVDTRRAYTARNVLEAGADIINDISGAVFDPEMADVLAEYKPGYILGHCPGSPATMQARPRYDDVVEDLHRYFEERLNFLERKGFSREYVALDPGIGFGKTLEHNLAILRNLDRFKSFGLPVCLGLSRKTLIGDMLGIPAGEGRDAATQVLTALAAVHKVEIHRVHAVKGAVEALKLAEAVLGD